MIIREVIINKAVELHIKIHGEEIIQGAFIGKDPMTIADCMREYTQEFSEQFEDGSYMECLRLSLGWMIEDGHKEAIEIMKDLIRYRLQTYYKVAI